MSVIYSFINSSPLVYSPSLCGHIIFLFQREPNAYIFTHIVPLVLGRIFGVRDRSPLPLTKIVVPACYGINVYMLNPNSQHNGIGGLAFGKGQGHEGAAP